MPDIAEMDSYKMLCELIRADYWARPVPREVAP
jgi:hypothetical protein